MAVTFARIGCFTKAYAKTAWSWAEVGSDGKKQESFYWDDHAYGSIFDCPSYESFIKKKLDEEAKQSDVDAFFSSLENEHPKLNSDEDIVKAPPKFDLNPAGLLYALPCVSCSIELSNDHALTCLIHSGPPGALLKGDSSIETFLNRRD